MAKPIRHGDGWRIRPYNEDGSRRSEVYSTFDDAVFALERCRTHVQEIKRGLRAPAPPTKTFAELCDYYLTHISSEKRRKRDDESIARTHLRPFFGRYKLQEVGDHLDAYRLARQHLNKKTLHNQLTLLISMLRLAHEKEYLVRLPKVRKPKLRLFDKDFHYLRTEDEIARFLLAARVEGELAYVLYATAVYTGLREGEIAGLRWDDILFDRRLIVVQRSYDGLTKNGEVRYVPILDPLLPLLREWRLRCPGTIVFPSQRGTIQRDSGRIFQEAFHRTLDRAGFPRVERSGRVKRYIVFHDLRHTFASHWMMRGGDLFKLQKILGHKSAVMTQRYAHLAPEAFASDHGRFGAEAPGARGPGTVVRLSAAVGTAE